MVYRWVPQELSCHGPQAPAAAQLLLLVALHDGLVVLRCTTTGQTVVRGVQAVWLQPWSRWQVEIFLQTH